MRSCRSCLQPDHIGHVLVGRCFLLMRLFPARQIPNLKTTAPADERDFASEPDFFAKLIGQNEPALAIDGRVLCARMQLPQKNAPVAWWHACICFGSRARAGKLLRRHDEKKLVRSFGKQNDFFGLAAAPARGNSDAIFFVDEMAELAGAEGFGWRRSRPGPGGRLSILTHFDPLLTTSRAQRQ